MSFTIIAQDGFCIRGGGRAAVTDDNEIYGNQTCRFMTLVTAIKAVNGDSVKDMRFLAGPDRWQLRILCIKSGAKCLGSVQE